MKRKFLALLLATLMIFTLCAGTAFADGAEAEGEELVVLYTNDVHCAVDDNLGYQSVALLKSALEAQGREVLLADMGDAVQGGPIGTLSKGEYIIDIMNELGYDVATPGNHEFDYGMDQFFALTKLAEFPFISANFMDKDGKAVLDAYTIIEAGGRKIGFVGISTPRTVTTSTPAYFQDDKGEWIYSFGQDATGDTVYDAVQAAVDAAREEGAEIVIGMGHLGIEADCSPWTSSEVITHTSGIDVMLDGHSHTVMEKELVKNKEGKEV
ncbi:MAG: bifunctional metallophosphatase/5'-nucleotidase [Candidatus Limivicinus sp.]